MEKPYSDLDKDDFEEGEESAVEFFRLNSLKPDVKVELSNSNFHTDRYRNSSSLLTCSSKYGYFIGGSLSGFVLGQTQPLRSTIYQADRTSSTPFDQVITVPVKEGQVNIVTLTSDNLQLLVGVSGGILLTYNISDIIKNKENTEPVQSLTLDSEIIYIQPNPEVYPDVIAVITQNNECELIRFMTNEIIATISNSTVVCWSPKGKQIVCGTRNGMILAYDIEGNQKDKITPPPSQTASVYVNGLLWVENHVFLAIYSRSIAESNDEQEQIHTPYIINRKSQDVSDKYKLLGEVSPIYDFECPDSHFYMSVIRDFGKEIKTLIVIANAAAQDLAVVGQEEDGSWSTWMLDHPPTLPLSEDDVTDTYPVGLTIDFSATEPLPPVDPAESEEPVAPVPVILFMTNEGRICAYHVYNSDLAARGEKYAGMITAQDVNSIPEPAAVAQAPEATATVVAAAASGSGAFGTPSTTSAIPAFGEIPNTAKISSFSSLKASNIPKPSTSASSSTSFGSSAPTFGSTSSVGFGSSPSAFGSAAGITQQKSFASLAKPSSTTSTPASANAFGFGGATNVTTTFGQSSGFGQTSTFGHTSSPFGSKPASFGATTSALGYKPLAAYGSASSLGENKPAFGQTSSFGSTSSFGESKPAFGQATSFGEQQPKSAFGEKPVFGSKTAFGQPSAFGQATSSFGSSPTFSASKPFGDTSFGPTTAKKPAEEEEGPIVKEVKEGEESTGAKSMFGLPPSTTQTPDIENKEEDKGEGSCSMSFEQVKRAIEDDEETDEISSQASSDISRVSSIDKSRDPFEFSVDSMSDALGKAALEKKDVEEIAEGAASIDVDESRGEEEKVEKGTAAKEDDEEEIERHEAREREIAEARRKVADKEKRSEEENTARQKKLEEEKRIAEEKRLAQEQSIGDEQRLAKEKQLAEERRIAEEKRLAEEKRIAEEPRLEEERLAAIKPNPLFAIRDRQELPLPASYPRAKGISGIAQEFESAYFNTLQALEETSIQIMDIDDELLFQTSFASSKVSNLENQEYVWKLGDIHAISEMMDTLDKDAEKAERNLGGLFEAVYSLTESTNALKADDLRSCLESKDNDPEALYSLKNTLQEETKDELDQLQTRSADCKEILEDLEEKLKSHKQKLSAAKSKLKEDMGSHKLTLYTLRRTMRDIDRSINQQINRISYLEQEELALRLRKSTDKFISKSKTPARVQRGSILKTMFDTTQMFGKPLNA